MKKTILLSSVLVGLFFTNCSSDDSTSNEGTGTDVEQNIEEETNIEITTLEDGISIEGATFETGTLTPNELTSFSVNEIEQSGFQDVGFEIELNVPDNYAGAYLQLLSEDGTTSENYYDIPDASFSRKALNSNSSSSGGLFSTKSSRQSAKSLEDEVTTIEVDFDSTIPAGSFCYYLCIYDTEGNISAPQTLCVEVEAWGGNDALVGNWTFTKIDFTEFDKNYTQTAGQEICDNDGDYSINCYDDNGSIIKEEFIEECNTIISLLLNLNSNGSQSYTTEDSYTEYDYEQFSEDCTLVYDAFTSKDTATGNWAYNEEEKILTIIDYSYDEVITKNGEDYDDGYDSEDEVGIGFNLYVTKASSNELILEARYNDLEYLEDGSFEEYEYKAVYYFTK